MTSVAALVLAAGAGRRFGGPKQLAPFRGRPLLEHAIRAASDSPVDDVVLVLGSRADEIAAGVDLARARVVRCERWEQGHGASLRAGLEAALEADAAVVLLGDQPCVSAAAVRRVIEARGTGADAVRATYDGRPSHPVLVERALFDRLLEMGADAAPRDVLPAEATRLVGCDELGSPDDVDTPEDLARLELTWAR